MLWGYSVNGFGLFRVNTVNYTYSYIRSNKGNSFNVRVIQHKIDSWKYKHEEHEVQQRAQIKLCMSAIWSEPPLFIP